MGQLWEKMSVEEKLEYLKKETSPRHIAFNLTAMVEDINDRLTRLEKAVSAILQKRNWL